MLTEPKFSPVGVACAVALLQRATSLALMPGEPRIDVALRNAASGKFKRGSEAGCLAPGCYALKNSFTLSIQDFARGL